MVSDDSDGVFVQYVAWFTVNGWSNIILPLLIHLVLGLTERIQLEPHAPMASPHLARVAEKGWKMTG